MIACLIRSDRGQRQLLPKRFGEFQNRVSSARSSRAKKGGALYKKKGKKKRMRHVFSKRVLKPSLT